MQHRTVYSTTTPTKQCQSIITVLRNVFKFYSSGHKKKKRNNLKFHMKTIAEYRVFSITTLWNSIRIDPRLEMS